MRALLDSGASVSVISKDLVDKFRLSVTKLVAGEPNLVLMANGAPVEISAKCEVPIKINGLILTFPFFILPSSNHELILGLNFLEKNCAHIDFSRNMVTFLNDTAATSLTPFQKVCYLKPFD